MKPQEPIPHNYAMSKLNAIFAFSAILLLASTGLTVFYDYVRGWKFFQAEFMRIQSDRIEQELKVADDSAMRAKIADLDRRTKDQQVEIARHRDEYVAAQKDIDEWEGKHYAADQDFRFAKAHLDAQRYIAEASVVEGRADAKQQQAEYARQQQHLADLNLRLQQVTRDRDAARARLDQFLKLRTDLENQKKEMTANVDLLNKQLENVTANKRTLILNAPMLDFINPTFKIDQVVLADLFIDMNYMSVPRVDRCQTCHRAIDRPGFESKKEAARLEADLQGRLDKNQIAPAKRKETEERIAQLKHVEDAPLDVLNPYRTHPKLDVFVGSASPHPLLDYGCTVCHRGQDRATEFGRAGHTPPNRKMERRWEEAKFPLFPGWWDYKNRNWGYESNPFLETPMYPRQHYEAGCLKCHGSQMQVDQGDKITEATHMVELYGCHACHKIGNWRFENLQKPGPTLNHIAEKVTPDWAFRWISNPRGFKSTTRMPAFFYQRNMIGPHVPADEREQNIKYQDAEIHALVTYLFDHSTKRQWLGPNTGNAANGKQIVESVGCLACHVNSESFTDKDGKTRIAHRDDYPLERNFGYNLANVGSKTYPGWIYNWIKNPHNYDPTAPMPSLRLSDTEAADVTAYLMTLQKPQFMKTTVRRPDPKAVHDLAKGYLINTLSDRDAESKLAAMSLDEQLNYLGQRSIEKYGCYSCHEIKGFEDLKPIGTELTTEGSKALHLFDFGFVHDYKNEEDGKDEKLIDTVPSWVYNKVRNPRVFDDERTKVYNDKLKMPNFGLTQHEAELITSVVVGMTKEKVSANRLASMDSRSRLMEEGRKLVSQRNCRGCHVVDGSGRAIAALIKDPNFLPPDLSPEGGRGQSTWLFNFLKDPTVMKVRPWMAVRMPTFQFTDDEANRLVLMFAAEGKAPTFDTMQHASPPPESVAIGREVFAMLRCAQCHVITPVGDPSNPPLPNIADTTSLAPNLTLAKVRLRHDWIDEWIRRPDEMIPGTRMPTNFPRDAETGGYQSPLANAIDTPNFAAHKAALLPYFHNEDDLRRTMKDAVALTGYLRDYIWSIGIPGMRPPQPLNAPPAVTLPGPPNTPPPTPVQTGELGAANSAFAPRQRGEGGRRPDEGLTLTPALRATLSRRAGEGTATLKGRFERMKKFLALLFATTLLTACGGGKETTSKQDEGEDDQALQTASASTAGATATAAAPVVSADAATITGVVKLEGVAPKMPAIQMSADPYCQSQHPGGVGATDEEVVVGPAGELANVIVYVKNAPAGAATTTPAVIDQKGCQYRPHVQVVEVGQPLQIRNDDATLHNIHAMPNVNAQFNEGQPVQGMVSTKKFEKVEMIPFRIKCDVHGWMKSFMAVLPHPYHSVSQMNGTFSIGNLPPGTYTLTAWHEKYGTQEQQVTVGAKESKAITFTFKG